MTPRLPRRTQQVLDCLLEGMQIAEIAKTLHIAKRTVKIHLARLYLIYDIDDRWIKSVRLVYLVLQEGR